MKRRCEQDGFFPSKSRVLSPRCRAPPGSRRLSRLFQNNAFISLLTERVSRRTAVLPRVLKVHDDARVGDRDGRRLHCFLLKGSRASFPGVSNKYRDVLSQNQEGASEQTGNSRRAEASQQSRYPRSASLEERRGTTQTGTTKDCGAQRTESFNALLIQPTQNRPEERSVSAAVLCEFGNLAPWPRANKTSSIKVRSLANFHYPHTDRPGPVSTSLPSERPPIQSSLFV